MDKKAPVLWGDVQTLFLQMFPVGSFIINNTGVNPSTYLGGTWQKVADNTFLVTGGGNSKDNNVKLTASQIPPLSIEGIEGKDGYGLSNYVIGFGQRDLGARGPLGWSQEASLSGNGPFQFVDITTGTRWSYECNTDGKTVKYPKIDISHHKHNYTNNSQASINLANSVKRTTMYVWYRTA